ncbi:glycosyltransferase family 4 protein [Terrihabitans sp. B22-R8]|uniref:glycosyltransferase family 4 protein n=1 Tax=Terrihabitans sp. B22-R8 TaxID=3425128 RepID=UPI00403C1B1E
MNVDLRAIHVVAPNLNRRFSGVTATILALIPHQARSLKIAALGHHIPADFPRIGWSDILRHGWTRPSNRSFRIWHARRNIEMIAGVLLRDVLRQPWRLVFTSAAQRHHTSFTKWLIRRMDAVIATSPQAASYLEVLSTTIMHGVDLDKFRPSEDRAAEWAKTGLPGRYGIGAFGRIRHQKGTDLFVQAMCRLLPKYPDFTAVVIGLATPDNAGFLNELRRRVTDAGLTDRILFLGELPADEIPGWFRRLLIHVAPQRWEGFGLTPLEAMASSTAVVATRAGVFEHLVADAETGFVVDIEDLPTLTSRLETLMADPGRAELMARSGRVRAEKAFGLTEEARRIGQIYAELWKEEVSASEKKRLGDVVP